jgi:hypothetical protein
MNHITYPETLKGKTECELRYIIQDCKETINLQGDFNPNCSYYADEINYCVNELNRRKKN